MSGQEKAYGGTAAARRGVMCQCGHPTHHHEGDEYGFCLACDCNHYRPVIAAVSDTDKEPTSVTRRFITRTRFEDGYEVTSYYDKRSGLITETRTLHIPPTCSKTGDAMDARNDAVTKMAAALQIAIGYAGGAGAVPTDEHAKQIAEPVVDSLIRAAAQTPNL